jgi:hypothetical protein
MDIWGIGTIGVSLFVSIAAAILHFFGMRSYKAYFAIGVILFILSLFCSHLHGSHIEQGKGEWVITSGVLALMTSSFALCYFSIAVWRGRK